jgi:hypothetical protein
LFSAVAWAPPGRKEDAPRSGAKLVLRTLKNTHTRFPYEENKKKAPDWGLNPSFRNCEVFCNLPIGSKFEIFGCPVSTRNAGQGRTGMVWSPA